MDDGDEAEMSSTAVARQPSATCKVPGGRAVVTVVPQDKRASEAQEPEAKWPKAAAVGELGRRLPSCGSHAMGLFFGLLLSGPHSVAGRA